MPSKDTDLDIYNDQYYEETDENDIGEYGDYEQDFGKLESISTLRRASAFAFEHIAKCVPKSTFDTFAPLLNDHMQCENQQMCEASVLVLGAICEEGGCYDQAVPYADKIVPVLFKLMTHEDTRMKITTSWTLSKFSPWIADHKFEEISSYLNALLEFMQHKHHEVRESACTGICELIVFCETKLEPAIEAILKTLNEVFESYAGNSLVFCLEMVNSLICTYDTYFDSDQKLEALLRPLIAKWNQIEDTNPML